MWTQIRLGGSHRLNEPNSDVNWTWVRTKSVSVKAPLQTCSWFSKSVSCWLVNNSWTCCSVLRTGSIESLKRFVSNERFVHQSVSAPSRTSWTQSFYLSFTVVSDCHSDPVPAISTKWNNNRGYSPGALSSVLSVLYLNKLFSRGSLGSLCPSKPKPSLCLSLCDWMLHFFFLFHPPSLSNDTRWLKSACYLEWKLMKCIMNADI